MEFSEIRSFNLIYNNNIILSQYNFTKFIDARFSLVGDDEQNLFSAVHVHVQLNCNVEFEIIMKLISNECINTALGGH